MVIRCLPIALILLIISVLICPLLLFTSIGQAYGTPDVLDLQLDDPAIIHWDITGIMPGDSGTQPINLYNAGDISGYIYIWINDIVDGEGLNPESETGNVSEPGEMSSSIQLDIVNAGINFGKLTGTGYMEHYDLPVNIASFPESSNQALFLLDTAIGPGETFELQWQWQLPENTGNQVQGDTVSFTFYYMLSSFYTEEEEPEPSQPPVYYPPPTMPPSVPSTTPTIPLPTAEPPTTPEPDEPEKTTEIDETDITYVILEEPKTTTPVESGSGNASDLREKLAQASLGVAITGTTAMTTLAIIQRIRRIKLSRLEK